MKFLLSARRYSELQPNPTKQSNLDFISGRQDVGKISVHLIYLPTQPPILPCGVLVGNIIESTFSSETKTDHPIEDKKRLLRLLHLRAWLKFYYCDKIL